MSLGLTLRLSSPLDGAAGSRLGENSPDFETTRIGHSPRSASFGAL
jgi:hypothetical protein